MLKRAVVEVVGKIEGFFVMWEAVFFFFVGFIWVFVFSLE